MTQSSLPQIYQLARDHQAAGRLPEAEKLFRQILVSEPFHPDALHFLGVVLTQEAKFGEAINALGLAMSNRPEDASIAGDLGAALQLAGRYDEAITVYRRVLDLQKNSLAAWLNMGQCLYMQRRYAESVQVIKQAAALNPRDAEIQHQIAVVLRDWGDDAGALAAFDKAIELRPDYPKALGNMGALLLKRGDFAGGVAAWRRALEIDPSDWGSAYNLGTVLRDAMKIDEAIAALRLAVAANPNEPKAWNNLAGLLKDAGELDESLACYDRAIALSPESAARYSNRLYTLHFHPGFDAKQLLGEHLEFARRHIAGIRAADDHLNDRDPERPLRIGYVSADFRRHPVGLSFEFLLENHDKKNFQTICFSNVRYPDNETERMQRIPDEWHAVSSLTDDQLAELVRERKIDILVDLSLHMAHNRLTMFARKPAPIQVTYLGYPSTTGVAAIDYRLSDAAIDPPGRDGDYTEKTIRLPRTYLCWRWSGAEAAVNSLPAKKSGYVTFGSLNNFCKVTPAVLDVWGRLMARVHNSRLILRCMAESASWKVLEALGKHGVAADRVLIVGQLPWDQYVGLFDQQDIGLDPFPYPGHTTSLDSFWMGVPVVTLTGDTAVSRVGASLLRAIGLPELIARTEEEYIEIAAGLANDLGKVSELRGRLREMVRQSAVGDGPQFARDVEGVYRQMWRDWARSGR
jgi:protein O-GlcNAc transferase